MAVVLFSGHMVDAADRVRPRFPPDRVPHVRRAMADAVSLIEPPDCWAVSGLACGGDLIFAAQWIEQGRNLQAFLPRPEEDFLDESVRFTVAAAVDRKTHGPNLRRLLRATLR